MSRVAIAVLISGGGTNLQALIDSQRSGALHSGEPPSGISLTKCTVAPVTFTP